MQSSTAPRSLLGLTLLLGTLSALGPLTIDMYLPGFPELARSLDTSVAAVQLTLASYLAGLAAGQFLYGPLSDGWGRRRPLLAGLGLYVAGSVGCALAPGIEWLVAARFVQGFGGCAGMAVGRAVVRDRFGEGDAARVYSSLMLVMGAAPILAPFLGAQLLAVGGWRAIFWVLTAAGAAVWVLVAARLEESLPEEARTRQRLGHVVRTGADLLRQGRFLRPSLASGSIQAAMFAYISGAPFLLIELFGIAPEHFGFVFGANALGLVAASQLNRWLVPRAGVQRVLRGAVSVAALAYGGLWLGAMAGAGPLLILPLLFLGIASVGAVLPNATAAAMAPFGRQAGIASAVLGTLQTVCGALAAAAVGALADGTARPMATVMLVCGLVAVAAMSPVRLARGAAGAGAGAR